METKLVFLDNPTDEQRLIFQSFFSGRKIELKLSDSADSASILVAWPGEKQLCEAGKLYAGGRVDCVTAFELADNIGLDRAAFGELLDELEIKVRDCQIGCF